MNTESVKSLSLTQVLEKTPHQHLSYLADILTDFGSGRLMLDSTTKDLILSHQKAGTLKQISNVLAQEVCSFAGNSAVNAVRSAGISYQEALVDVADEINVEKSQPIFLIEQDILKKALVYSTDLSGSRTERAALAARWIDSYQSDIVIKHAWKAIQNNVNDKLTSMINTSNAAKAGLFVATRFNPFVAIATTLNSIAGPAFRITIPCIILIACYRHLLLAQQIQHLEEELAQCL